ncbi:MAG: D-amino-acid transaminase [Hyphomonadaceae bacterium]|nr:D-amino-acid transaminase [Hyphomonadaceae bacterium]
MSRIAYVDGAYGPLSAAHVSVEDRGFQFGDAVYEVWAVRGGELLDAEGHFTRLRRSLGELRIAEPMGERALRIVLAETVRRNRVKDGIVYLQVSRGAARRDHAFPDPPVRPTIVVTARAADPRAAAARREKGVAVISAPDIRWGRCDIKTVNLLPNILAKEDAKQKGAFEVWLVNADGLVTEGSASNAWIVDASGRLRTAPKTMNILHGITRDALIRLAEERQIAVDERPFTLEEAYAAREAFLSSASNAALPIVAIDGRTIGEGRPGPLARTLSDAYFGASSD